MKATAIFVIACLAFSALANPEMFAEVALSHSSLLTPIDQQHRIR